MECPHCFYEDAPPYDYEKDYLPTNDPHWQLAIPATKPETRKTWKQETNVYGCTNCRKMFVGLY